MDMSTHGAVTTLVLIACYENRNEMALHFNLLFIYGAFEFRQEFRSETIIIIKP